MDSLAFDLCLSWEVEDGGEEGSGELGILSELRRSACGSGDRCGLWSSRESLPKFTYLFFRLAWPTFFLLTHGPGWGQGHSSRKVWW